MNKLEYREEFHAALADYHISKAALHSLSQTQLVLLVATTSSGRNTILRELIKTGDYHYVISDTTRQPRVNDGLLEQNGVEYWFRDEADMLADVRAGKFLEAAVIHEQQVSGISIRELEAATAESKIAITDAEVAGADNAVAAKPDTIAIFVLPPSFDEWQRRLRHRGHMDRSEFKRRMQSAAQEYRHALSRDYYRFVVNDSVVESAIRINQIVKLNQINEEEQKYARTIAETLLLETDALLSNL